MIRKILMLSLLSIGFCHRASAQFDNAGQLAKKCKVFETFKGVKPGDAVTVDMVNLAWCTGYIEGWMNVNSMAFESHGKIRDNTMIKVKLLTTDTRQIAFVFLAWMEKHPEHSQDSCNIALFTALKDAKLAGLEPTGVPATESREQ